MAESSGKSRHAVPDKCSSCQRILDTPLFCGSCRRLYPADGLNCFELLGLEPGYNLDPVQVRDKYLKLVRSIHPDRMASGADGVRRLCMRINAQVNQAYDVLRDPVQRAEYLLELSGGKSAADDKQVPRDVLLDALELREEIEAAQATNNTEALERVRKTVQSRFEKARAEIIEQARGLPGDDGLRADLRGKLNTIRYYRKMQEQL